MKKILLIFILFILSQNICYSDNIKNINIKEYVNKPYIGMQFDEALNNELPLIVIFAKPENAFMLAKLIPIAEMVYKDFKGEYNFSIINAKIEENSNLIKFFNPPKFPALYLIDTQNYTYTYIDKKYYNKRDVKEILTKFRDGVLFSE